jgi:hypothetical protein
MKTAFENTMEILRTVKPSMTYDGGDVIAWQKQARVKLS